MAKISNKQRVVFLKEWWPAVCRKMDWNEKDRAFRIETISTWIGRPVKSLNEVNSTTEFDLLKSEFMAATEPANFAAQMEIQNAERKRARFAACRFDKEFGGPAYRLALMKDKFGTTDLDALDLERLKQLRDTMAARASKRKK